MWRRTGWQVVLGMVAAGCAAPTAQPPRAPGPSVVAPAPAPAPAAPAPIDDGEIFSDEDYLSGSQAYPRPPDEVAVDPTLRPKTQQIVAQLLDERMFALGGVGAAGVISRGEQRTRELARQPDAIAALEWLVSQHRSVARLYAYWALRTLAPDRAAAHLGALDHDRRSVATMNGCMEGRRMARELARDLPRWPML